MLTLSIGKSRFHIPVRMEEATLAQCAWLWLRIQTLSPELQAHYQKPAVEMPGKQEELPGLHAPEEGAKQQTAKARPAQTLTAEAERFEAEALAMLAGVRPEKLACIPKKELHKLAEAVLPRFTAGISGYIRHAATGAKSFRHKLRKYHFPVCGTDITGAPTPLSGLTAAEFCQLSDIIGMQNMTLAPLAVALVCRPRREPYNELRAQRRAREFKWLPASIYWELWASVAAAHSYLQEAFPECYAKRSAKPRCEAPEEEAAAQSSPPAWSETLFSLALDKPSELEYLEHMNCYDFMRLLAANIRKRAEELKAQKAQAAAWE